jgi:hypothetical protein
MFKQYAVVALVLAASSFVVAAPTKATVTKVQGSTIVLKVNGKTADWIKKGVAISVNQKINGKVTEVTGAAVTVFSNRAGELKAGETISFDKDLADLGC